MLDFQVVGGSHYKWYQDLGFAGFSDNDNKRVLGFGLEQQEGAAGLTVKGSLKNVFESKFRDIEYFKGYNEEDNYVVSHQSRGKPRSKSRGGRLKCYICQSEDHLKTNCPENNRKKSTSYVKKDDQPSSSGSIFDDSEGMMECDEGSVLLGDNKECNIRGIGKKLDIPRNSLKRGIYGKVTGKLKVINGSRIVLSETQRVNCVYSLDDHAVAGELNASVKENDSLAQVWHKTLRHINEAGLQVLEKQELFGKKSLVQRVEAISRESNWRTVKKLRTYNGLEFYNQKFEQLCIESGIARHLTVSKTSQQNSKSPSKTIEKKTPIEMWSGHPSEYGILRIFGCVAYSQVKQGPYTPTTVVIPAVPAIDNSPAVPEQTTVETVLNMSPANKAHFESEKEVIHLILTGIGDDIY
ncbi:retrovirus-related pol polyprotein from transposon TNT 1-94 [Tanacetum coccineum]